MGVNGLTRYARLVRGRGLRGRPAALARTIGAEVTEEKLNPNAHHHELWLRDPDGYVVVVASPDGSAEYE